MDKVLYDAHPPMFRNHPLAFIACLLLCAVGIGILLLVFWYVLSKSQRLVITESEVRYEKGILSKARTEIGLKSIRSIRLNQTFFQRILGTADVEFYSAGDQPEITVKGLPDPHQIRNLVDV